MQNQSQHNFGTYAVMIARNILNKFGLYPSTSEIQDAFKNKNSIYHPILIVPMVNTLNGLIFSQIETYKIFCQKRLCDYIIFTNPTDEELAAANGQDHLPDSFEMIHEEYEHKEKDFINLENKYYKQLSETQSYLNNFIKAVLIRKSSYRPEYDDEFLAINDELNQKSEALKQVLLDNKQLWKDFTIKLSKVIIELGGFFISDEDDLEQRAELIFFEKLGKN